jgi:DNA mismatch repair protein MutH
MKINKGKTDQLLELTIGLNLSNTTLDFEDGELKTNKCDRSRKPLETMFITQTSSITDELLSKRTFEETKLYKKFGVYYMFLSVKMALRQTGCTYNLHK